MTYTEPEHETPLIRKQLVAELLIVLGLLYFPHIYNSIRFRFGPFASGYSGMPYWTFAYFAEAALILYLIWSGGESFSLFGFTKFDPLDLMWAIPIALSSFGLNLLFNQFTLRSGLALYAPYSALDDLVPNLYILAPYLIAEGLIQEVLFRSYLIRRLQHIGWKTPYVVILSAALYSSVHTRIGWLAFLFYFLVGLTWALYFVRLKRIWPLVLAHVCLNGLFYFSFYHSVNRPFVF